MKSLGKLANITITIGPEKQKKNLETCKVILGYGLEHDLKGGKSPREISLISLEAVNDIQANYMDGLCTKRFKANLEIANLRVDELTIGSQLRIGDDVILEVTAKGKRCFPNCVIVERGSMCPLTSHVLFAKVIQGGLVRSNDVFTHT